MLTTDARVADSEEIGITWEEIGITWDTKKATELLAANVDLEG